METMEDEKHLGSIECAGSLKNVIDAMYVLNGRWKLALILCLVQSPKRFGEIQHEITGISPKVLSNELKDLELNYLITRIVRNGQNLMSYFFSKLFNTKFN